MYFQRKKIFHTVKYLKQINTFIEMVICMAVGCKSEFPRGKNLKQQKLIKIKRRNSQFIAIAI